MEASPRQGRGPRFEAPTRESTSRACLSGMEPCLGPHSATYPAGAATPKNVDRRISRRLASESSRSQVVSSSKRVLHAACRPELLLPLDRLQREIEARGGHASVFELNCDDSSKASPTAAAPATSAAPATAAAAPNDYFDYSVVTSLPPRSPTPAQTRRVNNRRRQLRASPSVPARLDSELQAVSDLTVESTQKSPPESPAQQTRRVNNRRRQPRASPSVPTRLDSELQTASVADTITTSMLPDPIPHTADPALAGSRSHGLSAGRGLPVPVSSSRRFRSSPNLDLSGEHLGSYTARSSSSTNSAEVTEEICRAAEKVSGVRSSAGITTSRRTAALRGDTQPREFSRSTDKRISAQAAQKTPPPRVASTCDGHQRRLLEHHHSATSHALRTASSNFSSGGVTAEAKPPEALTHVTTAAVARSAPFAEKSSPQGNLIAASNSGGESAGGAGRPGHTYVESSGGSAYSGNGTSTNEDATFTGTFSVSRRIRAAYHARSTEVMCVAERISSDQGKSVVPIAPTPPGKAPHHPERQGGISGSILPRQQVVCVSSSPRQLQPRGRILGVRHSSVTDRFHVSSKTIGEGGSGEIRKCLEWSSGKVFACKTINKSNVTTRKQVSDLRTEVLLLNLLKVHDGVVPLHEVFEDHKAIHLIMELCHGGDLLDYIQNTHSGRLCEKQAAAVLKQLLHALSHCHSLGVIHRDVKPENILLCHKVSSERGNGDIKIKLCDFGVAGFLGPDGVCTESAGTSEYMAPEMARKAAYNAKADMWSAGVVLYAMLSGALPPWASLSDALTARDGSNIGERGRTMQDAIAGRTMQDAIAGKAQVALRSKVWQHVSDDAKSLLRGMLEKDPRKRLSADEALGHVWLDNSGTGRQQGS